MVLELVGGNSGIDPTWNSPGGNLTDEQLDDLLRQQDNRMNRIPPARQLERPRFRIHTSRQNTRSMTLVMNRLGMKVPVAVAVKVKKHWKTSWQKQKRTAMMLGKRKS